MIFLNQLYQYIQTFDSSTLYTTSPREHFKTVLKEIIHNAFYFKMVRYYS